MRHARPSETRKRIAIGAAMTATGGIVLPLVSATTANSATVSTWDKVAACESSGNWAINTGNTFYGGLQFTLPSWAAAGGTKYASRPDLASKHDQIVTAEVLLNMQGPGAWPVCGPKAGLVNDNVDPYATAPAPKPVPKPVPAPNPVPATYTVKSGDWLSTIARVQMGAANKWKELYAANKTVIGSNPNRIFPGQRLAIPGSNSPATKPADDNFTSAVLRLTNAERAKAGLKPLVLGPKTTAAAQGWADSMAKTGRMEHGDTGSRLGGLGSGWGENIAEGYSTPAEVMAGWMSSPGHRANILTAKFTTMGVGLTTDSKGRAWWVQDFVTVAQGAAQAPSADYVKPCSGPVTQSFGNPSAGYALGWHTGTDFGCTSGTSVRAAAAGVVVGSDTSSAYGTNVQIRHADGKYTLYAHLSSKTVTVGQKLSAGTVIGTVGNSGTHSSGPHLHLELRIAPVFAAGNFLNPVTWLRSHGVNV